MKRRSSWSAMWCRAVISSWESAGWVNNYKNTQVNTTVATMLEKYHWRNQGNEGTSGYLALDERSKQDKDRDTGPDNEVNKVPKSQTAHFSQSHLFYL